MRISPNDRELGFIECSGVLCQDRLEWRGAAADEFSAESSQIARKTQFLPTASSHKPVLDHRGIPATGGLAAGNQSE
jgi:hypothetical protein